MTGLSQFCWQKRPNKNNLHPTSSTALQHQNQRAGERQSPAGTQGTESLLLPAMIGTTEVTGFMQFKMGWWSEQDREVQPMKTISRRPGAPSGRAVGFQVWTLSHQLQNIRISMQTVGSWVLPITRSEMSFKNFTYQPAPLVRCF